MEAERLSGADEVLNELLVKLFKDIVEIEEKCLITREFKDISVNDMHVIEAIGIKEPKSMSTVAKLLNVTTGTLTKALRERGKKDKRVVFVSLTEKGKRAYRHHEGFHRRMIENAKEGLNEQETTVLVYSLAKLNDYFHKIYEES